MAALAARPAAWEGFVAAGFASGVLTVLIWRRKDVPLQLVIAAALVFRLFVLWLPPVLSDDAYRYVWDGVVQAEGHNPYLFAPDDPELAHLRDEPIYDALNSAEYHTVYPPVSQLIFRFGALFYEYGWIVSYFVIKAALALLEFGAVLVLARMLRPEQLLLYAWNPLVVIAAAGQAHGEAAAAFFLSLVLLALHQGRGGRASVWLACAGWVKLYPFVLFPFLWRRYGWRSAAAGGAATVILAAPYVHADVLPNVMQSLDLYVRYFEFNAGPYYALKEVFRLVTGQDWSKQLGPALRLCFLASLPVLYALDWKLRWAPRRALAVTTGLFLLCATTVHPWYLLGVLVLVAPAPHPSWHWYWLSVTSIGTYLLYVGGPYWSWVILGWAGFVVIAALRYRQALTDPLLRYRAKGKAEMLAAVLEKGWSVLDIGAGEGYVGRRLVERLDADVRLVDIVDTNRTALPHRRFDGRRLPYPAGRFDASILVFVLHHAEDPEAVLLEALRVSRRRVVVLESTYKHRWERPVLTYLDRTVNRLRSSGETAMGRESLHFRTHAEWLATFSRLDLRLEASKDLGGFIHHKSLFVLAAADDPAAGDLPGASGNAAAA
jgi:SAM-dependent methyltransferase